MYDRRISGLGAPLELKGVDYAMTALFIVIFIDQWKSQKNHIPALVGVFSTVVCLLIFGPESFIIPSMAVITVVFALFRKKLEKEESKND